jgi:epsin
MLRQFHFIDLNGKDQGINVRNRSKELVELLSDVDKIRTERKKARSNRQKYGGYEGGGGGGGGLSAGMSSGRMGGFGSESAGYGQYNGQVYGDGGGFGGQTSDYQDTGVGSGGTQRRGERFEEYDEYDEPGATSAPARRKSNSITTSSPTSTRRGKAPAPAKPKEPEEDLFDFGDEPIAAAPSNGKAPATSGLNVLDSNPVDDDDDFDDFQSAAPAPAATKPTTSNFTIGAIAPPASTSTTTSATQFAAPQPRSAAQGASLNDLFATVSPPPQQQQTATANTSFMPISPPIQPASAPRQQPNYAPSGPNYFQSVPVAPSSAGVSTPTSMGSLGKPSAPANKAAGGDAFASLLGGATKKTNTAGKGPTMADLAKQKTSAGIWGSSTPAQGQQQGGAKPAQQQKLGGGLDDLLG